MSEKAPDALRGYALKSSFSLRHWRNADQHLEESRFSADDRQVILHAAFRNRQNPLSFARAAIALRAHVNAGLPLNE